MLFHKEAARRQTILIKNLKNSWKYPFDSSNGLQESRGYFWLASSEREGKYYALPDRNCKMQHSHGIYKSKGKMGQETSGSKNWEGSC